MFSYPGFLNRTWIRAVKHMVTKWLVTPILRHTLDGVKNTY